MPRDPEKAKARKRAYRERQKVAKYGPDAAGRNMSGRHGNHARGDANGRAAPERRTTSDGYIAVRVPLDHPHAWGPTRLRSHRYAYEHIIVMMAQIGRPLRDDEVVHHRNGDRSDNRIENLDLLSKSEHAKEHASHHGIRDAAGRFLPGVPRSGDPSEWPEDLRVREFPR